MKKPIILLILGALFSIFLFRFDLQNGFEFVNIQAKISLIDFSGISSKEKMLTTQLIGYIFFLAFLWSIRDSLTKNHQGTYWFFLITLLLGFGVELIGIIQQLSQNLNSTHLRLGNLLTIIGIYFLMSIYKE